PSSSIALEQAVETEWSDVVEALQAQPRSDEGLVADVVGIPGIPELLERHHVHSRIPGEVGDLAQACEEDLGGAFAGCHWRANTGERRAQEKSREIDPGRPGAAGEAGEPLERVGCREVPREERGVLVQTVIDLEQQVPLGVTPAEACNAQAQEA